MFRKIIYSIILLTHIMTFITLPGALAATFAVFDKDYIRVNSTPETVIDTFTVLNPNTTWTLQAVNGNPQDISVKKVSSATLTLTG